MHGFDVLADPVRRRTIELIAQSERARGGQQRGAVTEAALVGEDVGRIGDVVAVGGLGKGHRRLRSKSMLR